MPYLFVPPFLDGRNADAGITQWFLLRVVEEERKIIVSSVNLKGVNLK